MIEPQPGTCPECGDTTRDHSANMLTAHAASWLADPDRTADETMRFFTGLLTGVQQAVAADQERWIIQANLDFQLKVINTAIDRRASLAAATTGEEEQTP